VRQGKAATPDKRPIIPFLALVYAINELIINAEQEDFFRLSGQLIAQITERQRIAGLLALFAA
jgi:hypothetical protein